MMNAIDELPNQTLTPEGPACARLIACGCPDVHAACQWLQGLPYGPNTRAGDSLALFDDGCGTCITKHGVAARMAEELGLPIQRYEGFYRFDSSIAPGCKEILARKGWRYVPRMHCFLQFGRMRVDLTEGNCHGKTRLPETYDIVARVPPDQTEEERRTLYMWGLTHLRRIDPLWRQTSDNEIVETLRACIDAGNGCPVL
jgi:hypothetical protein